MLFNNWNSTFSNPEKWTPVNQKVHQAVCKSEFSIKHEKHNSFYCLWF